jgi:hypothetical protein
LTRSGADAKKVKCYLKLKKKVSCVEIPAVKATEIPTIWPEAPRLCPQRPFPPYRFVPGLSPHPHQSPKGHSYGRPDEKPSYLPPDRWRENELYLYGIDLYHQGYLWESHEAWEALWHLTGKEDAEGQFLQGLIQNAAALLKVHLKQWDGARHLSREAHRRLVFVVRSGARSLMGVDVAGFTRSMESFYGPLWEGQERVASGPPRLTV